MGQLTSTRLYGGKKGLKTGEYYLRTRPAAQAVQFAVPEQSLLATKQQNSDAKGRATKTASSTSATITASASAAAPAAVRANGIPTLSALPSPRSTATPPTTTAATSAPAPATSVTIKQEPVSPSPLNLERVEGTAARLRRRCVQVMVRPLSMRKKRNLMKLVMMMDDVDEDEEVDEGDSESDERADIRDETNELPPPRKLYRALRSAVSGIPRSSEEVVKYVEEEREVRDDSCIGRRVSTVKDWLGNGIRMSMKGTVKGAMIMIHPHVEAFPVPGYSF
ncbi:hypothetical protein CPC08DRAFT_724582 [Agrocybe pediades]|nr:hypothetical protein CPC08DRAFT_724582 [Agrocybe pediades]